MNYSPQRTVLKQKFEELFCGHIECDPYLQTCEPAASTWTTLTLTGRILDYDLSSSVLYKVAVVISVWQLEEKNVILIIL